MSHSSWRSHLICIVAFGLGHCHFGRAQSLFINEFMASNDSTIQDPQGQYEDWVEIYNAGPTSVDLAGFFLTDDLGAPTRWQFPSGTPGLTTLPAGGFLVVWLDDDGNDAGLHANFRLGAGGEALALIDNDSRTRLDAIEFGTQTNDISYGRFPDGADTWQFMTTPTPNAANQGGYVGEVQAVDVSIDHGFFTAPLTVTLSTGTPQAGIYYTLDGADPYPADNPTRAGTLYEGPLTIDRTSCLRAKAIRPGWKDSPISTRSYLFLGDVVLQSPGGERPGPDWPAPTRANGVQAMDYGMDPKVTTDPRYADLMAEALLALPTLSLVTDHAHLFDETEGIYTHPLMDGRAWERPASAELILPDGNEGFQIDAGLRLRGGEGRQADSPKHGFRLFFRSDYGAPRLDYPLFGDGGADSFDEIDLRTAQSLSWHADAADAPNATWLYDVWTNDTERDLGQPYTRSRFVHLYLNGQYWGIYQTLERPKASYAASYFGGGEKDYDVIKSNPSTGEIDTVDGNLKEYETLWTTINAGLTDPNSYLAAQGLRPDGGVDPNGIALLDVDNLIDYMLLVFYSGNQDGPIGPPGQDNRLRNLSAFFNDNHPAGFQFLAHDTEYIFGAYLPEGVDLNRVSVTLPPDLALQANCNPWWIHERLMADNDAYYLSFIDRAFALLANNGPLSGERASERWQNRAAEISLAVIAESARWGDYLTPDRARTRDDDWQVAVDRVLNDYLRASPRSRSDILLEQLQERGWYPAVAPPTFSRRGGEVPTGFELSLSAPAGTIYYSLDGADPRFASEYGAALSLDHSVLVKTRAFEGDQWSPLDQGLFVVGPVADSLRVSEVMYHARDGVNAPDYLEVTNIGTEKINLSLAAFTKGVEFVFPAVDLAPHAYAVIAENVEKFNAYYPAFNGLLLGQFSGNLSNGGEQLTLSDPAGKTIVDFTYDDTWFAITDGDGYSLTLVDPSIDPSRLGERASWRPSPFSGGTPGQ